MKLLQKVRHHAFLKHSIYLWLRQWFRRRLQRVFIDLPCERFDTVRCVCRRLWSCRATRPYSGLVRSRRCTCWVRLIQSAGLLCSFLHIHILSVVISTRPHQRDLLLQLLPTLNCIYCPLKMNSSIPRSLHSCAIQCVRKKRPNCFW